MNLEQLRAKRNELADQMAKIAAIETEGTELTDEQATEFEQASTDFEKLDAQVKRTEAMEKARTRLAEPRRSVGAAQVVDDNVPIAPVAPEAKRKFECFEEFLAAVAIARSGGGISDQRLEFQQLDIHGEQSMDVGTKGGFMVPDEFRAQLLQVDPAQTPILASAMHLPPGSSPDAAVTLPMLDQDANQQGGVTVSRIGEGEAKPETDFDLKQAKWTPSEIAGHIALTDQLIRNWSGAMGMAQTLLGAAMNAALENECYNGTGVAQFLGILNSGATYRVNRAVANTFTLPDVANMAARKLQRGGSAFWLYNPLLIAQLMQMVDGNNNLVWQSSVVPGSPNTLWGLPAMPYEFASAVGVLGDVALVQPNPYYVIKDGSGPFVDVGFINTDFTTNRRRVKIFMLNDGGPWLQAPFELVNGVQVSPFVVLDVPA